MSQTFKIVQSARFANGRFVVDWENVVLPNSFMLIPNELKAYNTCCQIGLNESSSSSSSASSSSSSSASSSSHSSASSSSPSSSHSSLSETSSSSSSSNSSSGSSLSSQSVNCCAPETFPDNVVVNYVESGGPGPISFTQTIPGDGFGTYFLIFDLDGATIRVSWDWCGDILEIRKDEVATSLDIVNPPGCPSTGPVIYTGPGVDFGSSAIGTVTL